MTIPRSRPADVRASESPLVPGEFLLTMEDFRRIAAMLYADAGIHLPESKATLVYSRLAKRVRLLGLESFRSYCELVAAPDSGVDERQRMLAALTTNVTRFFREPHHFQHLKAKVLPPLLSAARQGKEIRIWSAGCSNGQEAYSIALTILELMPEAANYDVRILATDIDPNVVAEGRDGEYSNSVVDAVSPDLRKRWFTPVKGNGEMRWSVNDELRTLVTFRELNLIGNWPMRRKFNVIFCRNVVIYFDDGTQKKLWGRFLPLLAPGAVLYIGHSERLSGPAADRFESDGITTYRLKDGAST